MLKLENISLKIDGNSLFSMLNLEVKAGQVTTVMGPSGCGKSSLLAYLCGALPSVFQTSGKIILYDRTLDNLPSHERKLGILFQDDLLFPHLSVGENLAFALPAKIKHQERRDQIEQALEEIELSGMYERDPASLSGGQRARVAFMRTLLAQPEALLLDEPFSKLDQELRGRFRKQVFAYAVKNQLPTLLVTHDPADARAAGGDILSL
ncbi:MAG: ATP-binding cassette domain-containing protein [SAR324 cluster bacterium]|jgi:putative thiamine transport system ATP-binding protein|nr:ATP-binding cassette domain-containing protein [Deltaproteobacteria bacterium]MDG1861540.1 ATP-binding cassette domain-containing protein [SAR324 cluster bacterium]